MKRKHLRFGKGFRVAIGNSRSQAAEMVIAPGDAEGGPHNRHRGADQWLFVVSGTGSARVNGKRYPLRAGSLLLIEHADAHEIAATGEQPLRTLTLYVPPAYTLAGDELAAAKAEAPWLDHEGFALACCGVPLSIRSRILGSPLRFAQCAQQKKRPSASIPWPMIRQPQWLHFIASAWMAHSKLSNVWVTPCITTSNALS